MKKRRYPPFSRMVKPSKWQANHVFIITGPGAFDYAKALYQRNRYQPAIPCPENISPELYKWPVDGMEVTVKNLGTSNTDTEILIHELLKAGATLVANADNLSGAITIYRREGLSDVG